MAVLVGATKGWGTNDGGLDARIERGAHVGDSGESQRRAEGDELHLRRDLAMSMRTNVDEALLERAKAVSVEPTPAVVAEPEVIPEPIVEPAPAVALTEAEAVICAVFGDYCRDALAVARCESGPDYYAPPAVYHTGTFQLAFRYHGDKFAVHGWDMWATGDDVYQGSVVAFEIFAGRGFSWLGTSGWPVCGWEAGY